MIFGLTIAQFTALHVAISLIAIAAGLIALPAFARGVILPRISGIFLWTTLLTSLTGFLFPIVAFTPALGFGILSTLILVATFWAWYSRKLAGRAAGCAMPGSMQGLRAAGSLRSTSAKSKATLNK